MNLHSEKQQEEQADNQEDKREARGRADRRETNYDRSGVMGNQAVAEPGGGGTRRWGTRRWGNQVMRAHTLPCAVGGAIR